MPLTIAKDHYIVITRANGDHPFPQLDSDDPNAYVMFWPGARPVGVQLHVGGPPERVAGRIINGMEHIEMMANDGVGFLSPPEQNVSLERPSGTICRPGEPS